MKLNVPLMRPEVELDPHQVEGIKWMSVRRRFLLADEPGLGKSLQSMAVGALWRDYKAIDQILVVCPANLKWNFEHEIQKFTSFTTLVLDGTPKKREEQLVSFPGYDVLIVGYELLVKHLEQLIDIDFDYVVVDESHYVKTPGTARTAALEELVESLGHAHLALMTGTPLENSPNELWTALEMINPGQNGTYEEFKERWCIIRRYEMERQGKWGGTYVVEVERIVGCTDTGALHDLLAPHMLRRPSEILELDEPRFIQVVTHMGPKQQKMYREAMSEAGIVELTEKYLLIPDNRVQILRLRQIASTTATIDPASDSSAKLDVCEDKIVELSGTQSHQVVFTQFKVTAATLVGRLRRNKEFPDDMEVFLHTGSQSSKNRHDIQADWKEKGGILIATIDSAGTGLTLTDAHTLHVIEKPYTPSRYEQAWKRLHRRGQREPVFVYEYECAEIDEVVNKIHARKQKMSDEIVDGMVNWGDDIDDYWEWLEENG